MKQSPTISPTKKRKMMSRGGNNGGSGSSKASATKSSGGTRSLHGVGGSGRGGRPRSSNRASDDIPGFDRDDHRSPVGGRDPILDKRFFDGFVDDFDMSDLS
eukprot:CAMPEP_0201598688 /NCGR_PEP_ID=MMETSP0492-20130828/418_1 /ASSEMBLY_ACC=CAM_ASM_000837 /TAXON_ID=420259 /ORGANISM="Thalassiosira gravida, Strain GMp14c1" /LENGTH=101 /DNA_ID=CAMNT_0048061137 /DNA_START=195 /DNA_END=500 /DNA_ORIENTATION=-